MNDWSIFSPFPSKTSCELVLIRIDEAEISEKGMSGKVERPENI
jgi:hypothetical protein